MGLVQCLAVVLLFVQFVLPHPMQRQRTYMEGSKVCTECPPGQYKKSCTECESCAYGWFLSEWNRETECNKCFRDCSPERNLRMVEKCTNTTDLRCECEQGFRCVQKDSFSGNCIQCTRIQDMTTAAVISTGGKWTPSAAPSVQHRVSELTVIMYTVGFLVCLMLMILFCLYRPRNETYFRQTIAKLCNQESQDASHKWKESRHQIPRDSFRAKQQASLFSAANLGPVHVHNPGTVIFSPISEFTASPAYSQVGHIKMAEMESNEDDRGCSVCHPMPSPSIHLSDEERSGEMDNVFFPSQEMGKDLHLSKEEAL